MSTRFSIPPQIVIDAESMGADITSDPTIIVGLTKVGYQAVWSGTSPVGTLSVQVSNTYSLTPSGTVKNAGTWTAVELEYNGAIVMSVPVTGNTGSAFINLSGLSAYAVRLFYDNTSGSGTLNATICCKVS